MGQDQSPSRWTTIVPLILLVLAQPLLPLVGPALGHGGEDDGHGEGSDGFAADTGVIVGPSAEPLTPDVRYVDQRNPETSGDMVVWQQREVGRDWDIYAFNLTTWGPSFPVTLSAHDQVRPAIRGPWIAWEAVRGPSIDIEVINIRTGETFQVPDSGGDEKGVTIAQRTLYYYMPNNKNTGFLRGMDLLSREVFAPAGNTSVLGPPSAYGTSVAWAQGTNLEGKIRVWDRETGQSWEVPDRWNIVEGPVLGKWGVAFIADVQGPQRGTYTILYNRTVGEFTYMRTGIYPHRNLGHCESGITWDQFEGDQEIPAVTIWDAYTKKTGVFSALNHDADCAGDWLVFEKVRRWDTDDDLGATGRIYALDLGAARAPAQGRILLDAGLERGIYRGTQTFTGTIILGDPREPLAGLWGFVDGEEPEPLPARRTGVGAYEFRWKVDTSQFFSGEHTLTIIMVDDYGTETRRGFTIFTDSPYYTNQAVFDRGLDIPRERSSPFPFNVLDHYNDFRQFYNTILIVVGVLALIAWAVWHYIKTRPRGRPEYVRDRDDGPTGPVDRADPAGAKATTGSHAGAGTEAPNGARAGTGTGAGWPDEGAGGRGGPRRPVRSFGRV